MVPGVGGGNSRPSLASRTDPAKKGVTAAGSAVLPPRVPIITQYCGLASSLPRYIGNKVFAGVPWGWVGKGRSSTVIPCPTCLTQR